jgi:hypothetical protein
MINMSLRADCMRERLLSIAVLEGYAAMVPRRARQLDMMPACLVVLAGEDDSCDEFRQAVVDCGDTTHDRIRDMHQQQRMRGLEPHDALIWPHATFLNRGAALLQADEMQTACRRMPDPGWRVIVALAGGGGTALCLPASLVESFGSLASAADDLVADLEAEGDA